MGIRLNEDKETVARVKAGLKAKDGYCPCRLPKTEEYKCICKEFKEQMADPDFEGYCHCMLYYKFKDNKKKGEQYNGSTKRDQGQFRIPRSLQ